MSSIQKDRIIQELPLFAVLSRAQRRLVNERSVLREYRKGDFLYRQGDAPDALYLSLIHI